MEKVIEGNKLIAEFMGWEIYPVKEVSGEYVVFLQKSADELLSNWAKYHSSWNWIMPVVDKIQKVPSQEGLYKEMSKVIEALLLVDIKILWLSVVDFIKWYNQNK